MVKNKNKQQELNGIDKTMKQAMVSDVVHTLVTDIGLTTLANELDIDKAALSRFRSGDTGMTIENLDKLLTYGDYVLIPKKRYQQVIEAGLTYAELAKESMGL